MATDTENKPRGKRFRLTTLTGNGPLDHEVEAENLRQIGPPTFFAVTLLEEVGQRYLFLVQRAMGDPETEGYLVMLGLLEQVGPGGAARIPPSGGWQRAVVNGTIHVVASDEPLSLVEIRETLDGREPPPTILKPPFMP